MVKRRLILEREVQEIFKYIDTGQNFLLSGGAGSGKTFSLVQVIRQVILENPTSKVACITYTNAAVREIEERVSNQNLRVSTIHDFFWDNIKSYQRELKTALVTLINEERIKVKKLGEELVSTACFRDKEIQYKEYTLIREGIISHDEVLLLAHHMFEAYPKLCDILKDKFKFIFIDEYQDTSPNVIEIVLNFLSRSSHRCVIGFFGDSMQSIYDNSIGNLESYVSKNLVYEIKKKQNRRNPRLVYELANKLRTDGIKQNHSEDLNAPNMKNGKVKEGSIKFYYSTAEEGLSTLKKVLAWDNNAEETKELNLTHKLIASQAGFESLMSIYKGDKILEYKQKIKEYIEDNDITDNFSGLTFGRVIERLKEGNPPEELTKINPTDEMHCFIKKNPLLYEQARNCNYEHFKNVYPDTDDMLDDKKRDDLIKHLFKIQTNIFLYNEGKYNEFLRKTEFKIRSINDKSKLQDIISKFQEQNESDITIEKAIEYADEKGICKKDDNLFNFIESKKYVYDQVKEVKFKEFQNLYSYLEGYTPFSTQHKIKGAEFENIMVILDNGKWPKYNFKSLFAEEGNEDVRNRTLKLFYVCCTRAKENLVVYYREPSEKTLNKAKEWFGEENVKRI